MIDYKMMDSIGEDRRLFALWCNTLTDAELIDIVSSPYKWDWIQLISDPSEEVCMAAVSKNGLAIQCIYKPSEEVCMVAVRRSGSYIGFISDPSKELLRVAKESMIESNLYDYYINGQCRHYEALEAL